MDYDYLLIASLGIKLYEGNIVALKRFPDKKWIVRYGWFNFESKYYKGWYFSSLTGDELVPAIESDLDEVVVLSTSSDLEGPTLPVDPENPPEPYEPTEYLNDTYFPVSEKNTLKLVDGNIVSIGTIPNTNWILHKGWYAWDNRLFNGWYLTSLTDKSVRPVIPQEIDGMVVVSTKTNNLDQNYPNVLPIKVTQTDITDEHYQSSDYVVASSSTAGPHGPIFPPVAPDDEIIPYQVKSAFVTFPTIEERDKLNPRQTPDGKLVRVNDVDGKPEYYAWSINEHKWINVNFVFEERNIVAGEGIKGGGTLADDVTIHHGDTGTGEEHTYTPISQGVPIIDGILVDKFGHTVGVSDRDLTVEIQQVVEEDTTIAKVSQLPRWTVIDPDSDSDSE